MKTLIKIIWFSLALALGSYVIKYITIDHVILMDKLNAYSPVDLAVVKLDKLLEYLFSNLNNVLFFSILFLGLDIISGEIKGLIKGPIKLLLNSIMYILGFTIIFVIIGTAVSVSFN